MARVRSEIAAVLNGIGETAALVRERDAAVFADEAPLLLAVSALAEGSDRLFAREALRAGWRLDVVLPMPRSEYEKDFASAQSKAEFQELLGEARSVFELAALDDGADRSAAYEMAGLVLLNNSDMLLTVWNGQESAGRGGTREMIDIAVREGTPVVWVRSEADEPYSLWDGSTARPLRPATSTAAAGPALDQLVSGLISAPGSRGARNEHEPAARLLRYLRETERGTRLGRAYDVLVRLIVGKPMEPTPSVAQRQDAWAPFLHALPRMGELGGAFETVLMQRFLWADAVASKFAHLYRSAYVLNFTLAALAVSVGLLAVLDVWNEVFATIAAAKTVSVALEFALIAIIISITLMGRRAAWHERFLDARHLAEMLRHAQLLATVGRARHGLGLRASEIDPGESWTGWYARASLRELPLPSTSTESAFLRTVVRATRDHVVQPQIAYHHGNHHVLEKVHHRLDAAGEILFYATGALCAVWFSVIAVYGLEGAEHQHWVSHTLKTTLTFLGAVLPAIAAALAGIRAQGDFSLLAQRSLTTERELRNLAAQAAKDEPSDYPRTCAYLENVAEAMTAHLGTWRFMYGQRPLTVPG